MMLAVKNLTLVRDDRLVLDDISFDLGLGKLCWLRGPNGSGKTTLLQLLARLLSPTSGVINWRGQSAAHIPHYQHECFYLPHETGIRPEMTVGEHWQFVQRLWQVKQKAKDQFDKTLAGLADRPMRQLSQGQKKTMQLMGLYRAGPDRLIWLLDEPMVGLDDTHKEKLWQALHQQQARGGVVIMTSHEQDMTHFFQSSKERQEILLG